MATLKSIRKRILSVKNTQKITRAMKMVAGAKLRRAQQALLGARPHVEMLEDALSRLVPAVESLKHPLLEGSGESKKGEILVLTSDRGLCGGFNGNLLRRVDYFLNTDMQLCEEVNLSTIGRKGRDYYRSKKIELKFADFLNEREFNYAKACEWSQAWRKRFEEGEFDQFYLAYNSFRSAISQVPTIKRVFPLELPESREEHPSPVAWEGDPKKIIDHLLGRYVDTLFYVAVLESEASELGARMSAMDNATNNANEMIGTLTLQYNRARQAAITMELMDIVNGAEAL